MTLCEPLKKSHYRWYHKCLRKNARLFLLWYPNKILINLAFTALKYPLSLIHNKFHYILNSLQTICNYFIHIKFSPIKMMGIKHTIEINVRLFKTEGIKIHVNGTFAKLRKVSAPKKMPQYVVLVQCLRSAARCWCSIYAVLRVRTTRV